MCCSGNGLGLAPVDGYPVTGPFTGMLTETTWDGERLRSQLVANLNSHTWGILSAP
jgi:hypothetical protein